jgi:Bacterial protein of unknown function (DUF885)
MQTPRFFLFRSLRLYALAALCFAALVVPAFPQPPPNSYTELVALFHDWREFQKPKVINGAGDYSPGAMAQQRKGLKEYQARLAAFDISGCSVSQKIDYNLVRAEMNGMDFDHRVLRPWASDPAFYVVVEESESDVPLREGPQAYGVLETWQYHLPLSEADATLVLAKLEAIPLILASARDNLTQENKDLWTIGIHSTREESRVLQSFSKQLAETNPHLLPAARKAESSLDAFVAWLEARAKTMTRSPAIGIENYNWYLKNVHLVPYTWAEVLQIEQRELQRSIAALALERDRNRSLPELQPAANLDELRARNEAAIDSFREFLVTHQVFTVRDYMNQDRLRHGPARWRPPESLDVFSQVEYRDSRPMKTHAIHWLEKQRLDHELNLSPIRASRLLYNIWDNRSEGFATGWEEVMMNLGLYAQTPRARELVYFLVAFRCARGIADLRMHSGDVSLDDAIRYVVKTTPNGWVKADSPTLLGDLQIYAHQPSYGTTYIAGKVEFDHLLADKSTQMGSAFQMKSFMDQFFDAGVIPISMIRWQMTGLEDELDGLSIRR